MKIRNSVIAVALALSLAGVVSQVQREGGRTEHQLAHMSGMYAELLAKQGRPMQAVAAR